MYTYGKIVLLAAVLIMLVAAGALAQAPNTLMYQGKLTNALGPITSAVNVAFRIYDLDEGGVVLWTETQSITPNEVGVFTAELGRSTAFGPGVFTGAVRYLGITVGADEEMVPRQPITSVPYSLQSNTPGVAHSYRASYPGTTSYVDVDTLTVTVPGPGYLLLNANCRTLITSNTTSTQYLLISIATSPTTYYSAASGVQAVPLSATTATWESTMTAVRLEPVTAGEYTFYLNGRKGSDISSATMFYICFSAQYFPAWIGSDAPPVLTTAGTGLEGETTGLIPVPGISGNQDR